MLDAGCWMLDSKSPTILHPPSRAAMAPGKGAESWSAKACQTVGWISFLGSCVASLRPSFSLASCNGRGACCVLRGAASRLNGPPEGVKREAAKIEQGVCASRRSLSLHQPLEGLDPVSHFQAATPFPFLSFRLVSPFHPSSWEEERLPLHQLLTEAQTWNRSSI